VPPTYGTNLFMCYLYSTLQCKAQKCSCDMCKVTEM